MPTFEGMVDSLAHVVTLFAFWSLVAFSWQIRPCRWIGICFPAVFAAWDARISYTLVSIIFLLDCHANFMAHLSGAGIFKLTGDLQTLNARLREYLPTQSGVLTLVAWTRTNTSIFFLQDWFRHLLELQDFLWIVGAFILVLVNSPQICVRPCGWQEPFSVSHAAGSSS